MLVIIFLNTITSICCCLCCWKIDFSRSAFGWMLTK
uniref:Uncharacterized protein n=1 Tax=Arundo donax TaxID=35708 RepID=A0A0A9D8C7_ARUDO